MKELKFDAKVEELDAVLAFLDTELENLDCPMKVQTELDLAVEELFVNIANYAYGDKTGYALMKFAELENARGVSITFVDEGMQYNPLERPDPDITLPAEERPVGGLGIFLVKKIADEVNYNYSDGKNIFNFIKKF